MDIVEKRIQEYQKNHCWQYDIRLNTLEEDIDIATNLLNIPREEILSLKVSDFTFQQEEKDKIFEEVKTFIHRHEWLGRLSLYPTHFFTARYKGLLAGVIIMDMPNAFSKMLGEDTRKIERLISRGACISWSPKCLASSLLSYSMKWMVQNTRFRLFVAYSDPEAKELGTIYQACNFYYLGQKSGAKYQYQIESGRWVSDRYFRSRSVYKRLARNNGIEWQKEWQEGDKIKFNKMPEEIANKIKQLSKDYSKCCKRRDIKPKHKYAYILGIDKRETKHLKKIFEKKTKHYPYPKNRGE